MNGVTAANDVFLAAVRDAGGGPGPIARGAAMMHLAIHDAVVAITKTHDPYLPGLHGSATDHVPAAVRHAAHGVLVHLFPAREAIFNAILAAAAAEIPITPEETAGRELGDAAAAAIIADRQGDGSNNNTPYVASLQPGQWRPAPGAVAVTPNWGSVKPFSSGNQSQAAWRATFRPKLPEDASSVPKLLRTAAYAAQFDEVKKLGRATGSTRSDEQTDIAHFWANDLDGTSKPPGQLFTITKTLAIDEALDVAETARLFALVAVAMADAAVVAWDAKYDSVLDLWRPDTAIQLAKQDGNDLTVEDKSWLPLSVDRNGKRFSPAFPAYVSGHATFAAAHGRMMANYFGTDTKPFTVTTEDPFYTKGPRQYSTFSDAALENAISRIYLGVHYRWDADQGSIAGNKVANHVFATLLT